MYRLRSTLLTPSFWQALEELGHRARTIRALPLYLLCCDFFLSLDELEVKKMFHGNVQGSPHLRGTMLQLNFSRTLPMLSCQRVYMRSPWEVFFPET